MHETSHQTLTWQKGLMLRTLPPLISTLLRLLHRTLRYEVVCEDGAHAAAPGEPGIWCFWHRCLLSAACYFHGRPRTVLLISPSFDGELIARTIHRLGYQTARGSSSRAGAGGLRGLARAVRGGASAVIPGDGPRGPRYALKPGVIKLAQLTGLPVGCFYLHPQRAWVMRSWDALLVPQPFSRVVLVWGRTVAAPPSTDNDEQARLAVEATLERLRARAEAYFRERRAAQH